MISKAPPLVAVMATAWCILIAGCDHGLEAEPEGRTGLTGTLTFEGIWPPGVGHVAVAAYRDFPDVAGDLLKIAGWDTDVEIGVDQYDFEIELDAEGTYSWIVVAWRPPDEFWDFTSLLGCYADAGEPLPGSVTVIGGELTAGVDITVDFDVLNNAPPLDEWACTRVLPAELLELAGQG